MLGTKKDFMNMISFEKDLCLLTRISNCKTGGEKRIPSSITQRLESTKFIKETVGSPTGQITNI
jgi:hypothetical protein